MTDAPMTGLDYSRTLYLPKTDFPMRGGLPQKEPEILARWARENLYAALRESGKGRRKFVLHDGPPYANGDVHIGTALNKILKDIVVRSHQMTGEGVQLRSRLGLSWAADRMEGRGGTLPRQGQGETGFLRFGGHHRVPQGMPRLRRTLAFGAARRIQAAGRRRRLGPSLYDHELSRRGSDREGNLQVRRQRAALPRLQAGDVERRREDRAG